MVALGYKTDSITKYIIQSESLKEIYPNRENMYIHFFFLFRSMNKYYFCNHKNHSIVREF